MVTARHPHEHTPKIPDVDTGADGNNNPTTPGLVWTHTESEQP